MPEPSKKRERPSDLLLSRCQPAEMEETTPEFDRATLEALWRTLARGATGNAKQN